jgi:hypothetical protein
MPRARSDARDDPVVAIDAPPARPPAEAGDGARNADAWMRGILAAAALALAASVPAPAGIILAIAAVSAAIGVAPRATTLAIALVATPSAASQWSPAAALLLASVCAARMRLQLGATGRWLREVHRLETRRARAIAATGLARARRDELGDAALAAAGDCFERDGAARRELAAIGATPSRQLDPLLALGERLGRALRSLPRLRDALARALSDASSDQSPSSSSDPAASPSRSA